MEDSTFFAETMLRDVTDLLDSGRADMLRSVQNQPASGVLKAIEAVKKALQELKRVEHALLQWHEDLGTELSKREAFRSGSTSD